MPETYTEDLLDHLQTEQRETNRRINLVRDYQRFAEKYTDDNKAAAVSAIKAGHESCAVCAAFDGNDSP